LGSWTKSTFSEWFSPEAMTALSIVLTILVTVILSKVDVGKLAERFLKGEKPRKPRRRIRLATSYASEYRSL
jgi:hypothetical protein